MLIGLQTELVRHQHIQADALQHSLIADASALDSRLQSSVNRLRDKLGLEMGRN